MYPSDDDDCAALAEAEAQMQGGAAKQEEAQQASKDTSATKDSKKSKDKKADAPVAEAAPVVEKEAETEAPKPETPSGTWAERAAKMAALKPQPQAAAPKPPQAPTSKVESKDAAAGEKVVEKKESKDSKRSKRGDKGMPRADMEGGEGKSYVNVRKDKHGGGEREYVRRDKQGGGQREREGRDGNNRKRDRDGKKGGGKNGRDGRERDGNKRRPGIADTPASSMQTPRSPNLALIGRGPGLDGGVTAAELRQIRELEEIDGFVAPSKKMRGGVARVMNLAIDVAAEAVLDEKKELIKPKSTPMGENAFAGMVDSEASDDETDEELEQFAQSLTIAVDFDSSAEKPKAKSKTQAAAAESAAAAAGPVMSKKERKKAAAASRANKEFGEDFLLDDFPDVSPASVVGAGEGANFTGAEAGPLFRFVDEAVPTEFCSEFKKSTLEVELNRLMTTEYKDESAVAASRAATPADTPMDGGVASKA